jgi:hypothetical protein
LSKRGSHMCHVYIMIHVRGISLAIFRMRLCLQALATLSQAQIHNLVAFLLSKTVSPIPFPPLEINESPGLCLGSQRSCSGKLESTTVNLAGPIILRLLPPGPFWNPSTVKRGLSIVRREIDNWNKYCENASLRQDVLCPTKRALWYHIWLPLNGEMRGQPGVAI